MADVHTPADTDKLHAVARGQKLVIWAILAGLIGNIFFPLMLITIPFMLYAVYQLAKALELSTGSAVLYMIGVIIPLIGLICLLVLSNRATDLLRRANVSVGLMGARTADLPPRTV